MNLDCFNEQSIRFIWCTRLCPVPFCNAVSWNSAQTKFQKEPSTFLIIMLEIALTLIYSSIVSFLSPQLSKTNRKISGIIQISMALDKHSIRQKCIIQIMNKMRFMFNLLRIHIRILLF